MDKNNILENNVSKNDDENKSIQNVFENEKTATKTEDILNDNNLTKDDVGSEKELDGAKEQEIVQNDTNNYKEGNFGAEYYVPKKKKDKTWIVIVLVVIIPVLIFGVYYFKKVNVKHKYENAITLFDDKKYEEAYKEFEKLGDYELSDRYIAVIKTIEYLDKEEYQLAYDTIEDIDSSEISISYQLKKYAQNGIYYSDKKYKELYEDNKYTSSFYNDKEKEMVYDGMYNYGVSLYNEGYYGTPKEIFTKLGDYKNCSELLKDKYFQLIGNSYSYSVSSGYTFGYYSLTFYSSGDKLLMTISVKSIFDTSSPDQYNYNYKIKNNQLIMGDSVFVYNILSFDGKTLVIREGNSTFTMEKD